MAKYHATEAAQEVIDSAVQIFGGKGVTKGYVVESLYQMCPRIAHLRGRKRSSNDDHRAADIYEPQRLSRRASRRR